MRTLYEWFFDTARRLPDAPALVVDGHRLTYRQLATVAGQVAGLLAGRLVGKGPARVGVLASRSVTAYAGYLAALRLGAAAVPLNATFPVARIRDVAESAALDAIVVDDAGASTELAGGVDLPVLHIGRDAVTSMLEAHRRQGLVRADHPSSRTDGIAYIMFTSGSTGRPKGVPIRHRNVDQFLRHCIDRFSIGPGCRLSQTFDLTFDPSVFDMFACWGAGATLVAPSREDLFDPAGFVNRHRLTHWYSVPSLVSVTDILGGLPPGSMPSLRWSLFAGEQLTLDQARAWSVAAPASRVGNLYGPTELTVTVTDYQLPRVRTRWPATSNGTVPIGQLYPHLESLLLDPGGRPADEGELLVRGSQRFDGYLDPADNDGRFLRLGIGGDAGGGAPRGMAGGRPEPVAGLPRDGDWYRTGDRVRTEQGELLHLGRLDHQVKVQGQRVELSEIEVALRAQAGIRDAVAFTTDQGGEHSVVAVYTGTHVPPDRLRTSLRERLAPYMVPQRLVRVDALPLNDNRKIDRAALRAAYAG